MRTSAMPPYGYTFIKTRKNMKIDFEHIKQNYPILEVATRLGIDVNTNNTCLCKFHNDNNPSMSFDTRTNRYKCFACGEKGTNIDLVMKLLNYDIKAACEFITGQSYSNTDEKKEPCPVLKDHTYVKQNNFQNIPQKNKKNEKKINNSNNDKINTKIYSDFINMLDNSDAIDYLAKRRISAKIVQKYQIKNLPKGTKKQAEIKARLEQKYSQEELTQSGLFAISQKTNAIYNRFFAHRLIIPIIQNGQIVSLQARAIDDGVNVHSKYNNLKNNVKIFNLDILDQISVGSTIVICEGIIDCLSFSRLCYNAIAIGSSANVGKLDKSIIEKLKNFDIIVAGDCDRAGGQMNQKIQKLLDDNNIISYETIDLSKLASIFNIDNKVSEINDINEILSSLQIHTNYSESLGQLEFCSCSNNSEVLFLDYGYVSKDEIERVEKVSDIECLLRLKKAFDSSVSLL